MENIKPLRPGSKAIPSFHLAHVRSLIRCPGTGGNAIDPAPNNTAPTCEARVAGQVTVLLPSGNVSRALAFQSPACDEVPSHRLAHGVLDGTTYWFRCSDAPDVRGDSPCFRAYFAREGAWFFFYTQDCALPFGSEVSFSEGSHRADMERCECGLRRRHRRALEGFP
ncbi:hypothetical protein M3A49_06580 [Paraburkholderia sp. CNPSo 3076]|uniref:hypothetical protein n=1 Tax=Paraburkholderia sp. CNPSo 3076 TaxID=2940936 RepID=UPI002257C5AD|nr:hypothetical protein [Paraburkholderia sp. CNPSo 3076]MCX5539163.1 hypothetical protein [Paraburkholderia sp. CNPSo 3076]